MMTDEMAAQEARKEVKVQPFVSVAGRTKGVRVYSK